MVVHTLLLARLLLTYFSFLSWECPPPTAYRVRSVTTFFEILDFDGYFGWKFKQILPTQSDGDCRRLAWGGSINLYFLKFAPPLSKYCPLGWDFRLGFCDY